MHRRRADLDRAVLLANAGKAGDLRDVDQRLGLAEAQLHQRNETVASSEDLRLAAAGLQLRDRIVDRLRTLVFKCGGDHAAPPWPEPCRGPWMMRHSFSGRSIISMCLTPNPLSASTAADTMLGVDPRVPASPTPFAPSGFTGVGVTVLCSSKRGKSMARGSA